MSAGTIVSALRRHRADLARRWLGQFQSTRAAAGHPRIDVDDQLVQSLLADFIALLDPMAVAMPAETGHRSAELAALAGFPDNVAIAIDLLQAGAQVLGAFVVQHAGPWAAWTTRDRNRFLGELDAVFPLLVRRAVADLCARCLPDEETSAVLAPLERSMRPAWARETADGRN